MIFITLKSWSRFGKFWVSSVKQQVAKSSRPTYFHVMYNYTKNNREEVHTWHCFERELPSIPSVENDTVSQNCDSLKFVRPWGSYWWRYRPPVHYGYCLNIHTCRNEKNHEIEDARTECKTVCIIGSWLESEGQHSRRSQHLYGKNHRSLEV